MMSIHFSMKSLFFGEKTAFSNAGLIDDVAFTEQLVQLSQQNVIHIHALTERIALIVVLI